MAKGISSAYLPLAVLVLPDEIYQGLEKGSMRSDSSAMAPPIPAIRRAAPSVSSVHIIRERNLGDHVKTVSKQFIKRLNGFRYYPMVGDVRAVGLVGAVEFVANKKTKTFFNPPGAFARRVRELAEQKYHMICRLLPEAMPCSSLRLSSPRQRSTRCSTGLAGLGLRHGRICQGNNWPARLTSRSHASYGTKRCFIPPPSERSNSGRRSKPSWKSTSIPNEKRYFAEARNKAHGRSFRRLRRNSRRSRAPGVCGTQSARKRLWQWTSLTLDHALLCEVMGRSLLAPEVFNSFGTRHRQHGSADPLWHTGTARTLAEAIAGWRVTAPASR